MCVECGHDLSRAYGRAPGWRLWVVAGVIGVLAVGVGAGFAIGALTNDKQKKRAAVARATATTRAVPTLPAPAPPPPTVTPAPPTTPTAPAPGEPTSPATTTPATPPPATPTTPAPPAGGAIATWPAGKTAYTVVLISARKRSQANAKAKEAQSRGIDAGVLHSNDYSSLKPGYWVVFAGQYATSSEASSHVDELASKGFAGGYPRQIKK
jgi:septal ring-binding cell division protein DamX